MNDKRDGERQIPNSPERLLENMVEHGVMENTKPLSFFIVDDDEQIIELMAILLEQAGYSVSSDLVGVQAIPTIVSEKPDCVLTDLMMACLDGLELCRELRARKELCDLKIIMVSARTEDFWRQRAKDAGVDGYITKPLNIRSFVPQIEAIIRGTHKT